MKMRQGSTTLVDDSDDESFDFAATKDMLVLFLRAPLRRPKLAATIFVLVAFLAGIASFKLKPTYEAQAAIVVQKNAMMPTFGDTAKNAPNNDIDPAVGVSEAVKGRDNLVSLVRQTHLLERTEALSGAPEMSEQQKVFALAKALDRKLKVTSDGSLVSFAADWSDPQTAYEIVSAAVRNFLDARTAAEVAIVSDAIALLEEHAEAERDGIDVAMDEFLRAKEGWKTPSAAGGPSRAAALASRGLPSAAHQTELAKRLEETKQQMREIQEDRRRQLSELKTQLAGALATYTPSHPTAIGLQRKIEALSDEPANLAALKNEERGMLNELASMGAKPATGAAGLVGAVTGSVRGAPPASRQDLEIVDPASAMSLSKLQSRVRKYEDFMDQISAAKLELDLAKNAFKYRYNIYKPAELPTKPKYPIGLLLGVGGLFLGAVLAAVVATLVDLLSGTFVEPWQVKRRLDLPMLGEVVKP
jgi:uncharacterized protein involved in exopolysaccharide biosynthesis